MRVAVIELDVPNHYLGVNSIIKIYLSQENISIDVYCTQSVRDLLKTLVPEEKISFIVKDPTDNLRSFLQMVVNKNYNRIHISSLYSENVKIYSEINFSCPVYLGIHNDIVSWMSPNPFSLINIALTNSDLKPGRHFFYKLRKPFVANFFAFFYKRKFLKKTLRNGGKILVYGPNVEKYALKYIPADKIVRIPFAVFEKNNTARVIERPDAGRKLKVCIPGIVSETGKDYRELFQVLSENSSLLKNAVEFILLGKMESGSTIEKEVKRINEKGLKISYYLDYISEEEFSSTLAKSDIILGNMNVKKIPYGTFAETGIVYNMIRFAKPGLLPNDFKTFDELHSSTLSFNTFDAIPKILLEIQNDTQKAEELMKNAYTNSMKFLPENYRIN